MDIVREMQGAITGCITELESHLQSRESSLQVDREQSNLGLNIDNLVYTEMFRNTMMKAKIDMFYRYLDVFHDHHAKYYTRLLLKAKLHLGIVNEDILIKQFSQQSIDKAEIAQLKSPSTGTGKSSPSAIVSKSEDAKIKSYVQYDDMAESRQNVLSHIIASAGSDNSNGDLNDDDSIESNDNGHQDQENRFNAIQEVNDDADLDMALPDESEVHSFTAVMESTFNQDSIDERVLVDGYDSIGTIKYVGPHHKDNTPRIGIVLDTKVGRNNGTVKGHKYFECEDGFGVLVVPYKVHLVNDSE